MKTTKEEVSCSTRIGIGCGLLLGRRLLGRRFGCGLLLGRGRGRWCGGLGHSAGLGLLEDRLLLGHGGCL